jgi:hypothetical protein
MADELKEQRDAIGRLLADDLQTDWKERAYTPEDIQRVVHALQDLPAGDLQGQLRVAGFTLTPYVAEEDPEIEQSCLTCMYYEPHRRFCALPELMMAVEPEWSCILWRI